VPGQGKKPGTPGRAGPACGVGPGSRSGVTRPRVLPPGVFAGRSPGPVPGLPPDLPGTGIRVMHVRRREPSPLAGTRDDCDYTVHRWARRIAPTPLARRQSRPRHWPHPAGDPQRLRDQLDRQPSAGCSLWISAPSSTGNSPPAAQLGWPTGDRSGAAFLTGGTGSSFRCHRQSGRAKRSDRCDAVSRGHRR
jgi:hypothetical protein